VLKVIADHARQNGLAWPGMDLIAKEAHISYRQAFNIVPDLELAGLVKIHKTVGGAGQSNHYWVRVPWVEEPDCVLDLPKLPNEQLPPGVRRQRDDRGNFKLGPKGNPLIDVEYYVGVARLKTLKPVTGFISETEETLKPVTSSALGTLKPVTSSAPETLKPASGEPSSLRESSSSFEPSIIGARRAQTNGRAR